MPTPSPGPSERLQVGFARGVLGLPPAIIRAIVSRRPIQRDGQTLDPQTQWMLGFLAASRQPALETLTPVEARRRTELSAAVTNLPAPPDVTASDLSIPGPAGPLHSRRMQPDHPSGSTLVYFHGGGFVIGSPKTHEAFCLQLAHRARCTVISVDYRLAPEAPFPAAVDDALAAFRWVRDAGAALGVDPARIAVGGDSAGGSLAAVVCQVLRDAGEQGPCYQLLIYPSVDRGADTPSRTLFRRGFLLNDALLAWFMNHYLHGADPADPLVSPLRHAAFEGLPPAHIATAGFDVLRDEGEAYAQRLQTAHVPVTSKRYPGLIHGFVQMAGVVDAAAVAVHDLGEKLGQALNS